MDEVISISPAQGGRLSLMDKTIRMSSLPEYWLRGSAPGIPALLQPVAHALLQAREEISTATLTLPPDKLWERPNGSASPGFHLQHLSGVLDRLFTYALGKSLSAEQFDFLSKEGKEEFTNMNTGDLVQAFADQVDKALEQLANTDPQTLTDFRGVGRAQLPSNVIGLLFHAAEHTMRHTGQLLVTIKVLTAG